MFRSIRQLWQPFWQVLQFYWQSADAKQRRTAVLGLIVLTVLSVLVGTVLVFESVQRAEFISALAARDASRFRLALSRFVIILLLASSLLSASAYVRDRLGLQWRKGLTYQLTQTYLSNRQYYYLPEAVDNPDQRIEADVRNLTQLMLTVLTIFVESGVQLFGFVGVLLSISYGLTGFLLVYALLGSVIAILFFGRKLTRINSEQIKREANFRFNLTEIRDHAEVIALRNSQPFANARAGDYFQRVINNFNRFIRWQLGLDCFQNAYQYLTFILPSLILAPSILNGHLEIGSIVQSQAAFDRIWLSLSLIVVQFEQLTALAASTGRLQQLLQAMSPASHLTSQKLGSEIHALDTHPPEINRVQQEALAVQNLTLYLPPLPSAGSLLNTSEADTPDIEQQPYLFKDLSFTVDETLLVMGESGVGKSSLVKAIAGLWQNGKGTIISPHSLAHCPDSPSQQSSIIFLPQQPYMTLGSLRQQLFYPMQCQAGSIHSDSHLHQILEQVQLAYLGDLNQIADWSGKLSTGEQQRLAFARLFVHQPAFALLDEATSALSVTQEASLYRQLSAMQTTFVSVGHRPSLRQYHAQLLTLTDTQTWTMVAL